MLLAAGTMATGEEADRTEEIFEFDAATDADLFGVREYGTSVGAFRIRFGKDDGFQFFIPMEFQRREVPDFLAQGTTRFYGHPMDDPSIRVPVLISNRLVSVRNTLVAAKDYFETAADEAGVTLRYFRGDAPFDVHLTGSDNPNSFGWAKGPLKVIWLRSFWDDPVTHLTSTAIHEFFHQVQFGIFNNTGIPGRFTALMTTDQKANEFVMEATAQWAKDEPIVYAAPDGKEVKQDERNDYLRRSQTNFLALHTRPILDRDPYGAGAMFKYFTEQIKGGKDEKSAVEMVTFLDKLTREGTVEVYTVFPLIGEMLPESWGATREERWNRFFTRFFSAVIAWQAKEGNDPAEELGFHDDAFGLINKVHEDAAVTLLDDLSSPAPQVYAEPAQSDEERSQRLAALALDSELDDLTASIAHLDPVRENLTEPRPLFFTARSEQGHPWLDVLRQRGQAGSGTRRKNETFTLERALSGDLSKGPFTGTVTDMSSVMGAPHDSLWVNFCNPAYNGDKARVAFAYMFSPRLLSEAELELGGWGSDRARIVKGAAWLNAATGKPLQPGDTFVLAFRVPSALHGVSAETDYLEEKDCSFRLRARGENGEEIPLESRSWEENFRIRATSSVDEFYGHVIWTYHVAGKFSDQATYAGKAHFEIDLTSPLNLGEGDRQIDRSLRFDFRSKAPEIRRVVAREDGTKIYDSEKGERVITTSGGGKQIRLEIEFTQPMKTVRVTAGEDEPYTQLTARGTVKGDEWRGTLEVPGVPPEGLRLKLAVSGEDSEGKFIDAKPDEPNPQPDTNHWLLLGLEHWAEVTFTGESTQHARNDFSTVRGTYGPSRISLRLVPMQNAAPGGNAAMPDASAAAQKALEGMKKGLAAMEANRDRMLQNADAYLKGMIAHRRMAVDQNRTALAQAAPENKTQLEEMLRQAEKDLAEIDNNKPAKQRAAWAFDLQLEEMRKRIAAMEGLPEGMAVITRLVAARQRLMLPMDASGKIKASAVVQAQSGKITINSDSTTGGLTAQAEPSSSVERDILHLGMEVQSITAEDVAALKRMVDSPLRGQAGPVLRGLWEFFPESERPPPAEQERTMPPITGERLVLLRANQPFSAMTSHLTGQDNRTKPGRSIDQLSGFMWSPALRTPPNLLDLNASLGNYPHPWGYVHDHGKAQVTLATPGHKVEMGEEFALYAMNNGGAITGHGAGSVTLASSMYPRCAYEWKLGWKVETFPQPGAKPPPAKIAEAPPPPVPPPKPRPADSASATNSTTGQTTASTAQADGSREIIVTDRGGREISRRREPLRSLPSASAYDPATGVTVTSTANPDGSRDVQATSADGKVLWQRTVKK